MFFLGIIRKAGKIMARKDPKGRVLRRGESYRPDKNLYIYQYRDPLGQTHTLYASNIVDLRKKEDEVTRDRLDNIQTYVAGNTTLNYAYDRYISLKYDLKPTTKANYNYIYDHFVRDTIGKRLLKDIKYSDIKFFYYQLMNEWGVKPMTVDNVHTVLHPVFQMGIRDGIIRTNPTFPDRNALCGTQDLSDAAQSWEPAGACSCRAVSGDDLQISVLGPALLCFGKNRAADGGGVSPLPEVLQKTLIPLSTA